MYCTLLSTIVYEQMPLHTWHTVRVGIVWYFDCGRCVAPYKACSLVSNLGAVTMDTVSLQGIFAECSCWSHAHAVAVIVFAMHCVCTSSGIA